VLAAKRSADLISQTPITTAVAFPDGARQNNGEPERLGRGRRLRCNHVQRFSAASARARRAGRRSAVSVRPARGAAIEDPDRLAVLAALTLGRVTAAGASYADIRSSRCRSQFVTFRAQADTMTGKELEVPSVSDTQSFAFGLRVLADGAWGFQSTQT
jgi:hypothetical protein